MHSWRAVFPAAAELEASEVIGRLQGHNLVYLHVNYNTFRLAFWAVAHVMADDRGALGAITDEIDDVIASRDTGDVIELSVDDVESLQVLSK